MGKLCPEGLDEDLFFQMIVAFKPALHSLEANDERVAVNLLRCIQKITPSLIRSPRGPYIILWVPTCLLHIGLVSVFNEAARLLRVVLDSLYTAPDIGVKSVVEVFAQARAPQEIEEKLRNIDAKVGLMFSNVNFSFSMAHALFRESSIKGFSAEDYETKQVFYTSKDGTRVPMFLVFKRGLKLDGNNPTLLYAYGGFDVPLTPHFRCLPLPQANPVAEHRGVVVQYPAPGLDVESDARGLCIFG